jgi:hypothetical protein
MIAAIKYVGWRILRRGMVGKLLQRVFPPCNHNRRSVEGRGPRDGRNHCLTAGSGVDVETPLAVISRQPGNTVTGNYTLKGTFTLNKPSGHTNFYGLIFGGSALNGADQKYIYFMVAQTGAWLVKSRTGETTFATFPGLAGAVRNGAVVNEVVKKPDASGKSVNSLEVRVQADKIDFVVNGTVVHSAPKAGLTRMASGASARTIFWTSTLMALR